MLSETDLELLTGFVDGELPSHQREAALRLLNGSSEARSFLQDLQETAHRLHELPQRTLEGAFAGQVMQAIADRGLRSVPDARPTIRRPWQGWAGYLAAACLVLAVGIGVYLATRHTPQADNLVVNNPPKQPIGPKVIPQVVPEEPLRLTFKELAQQPKRTALAQELAKESAVHLDLVVHDYGTAVRHLEDVLRDRGIKTIVDERIQASLEKKAQGRVEYLVYAENVPVKELERILRQLGEDPKPADGWVESQPINSPSKKSPFESMVLRPLSVADREKLSSLGIKTDPIRRKGGAFDQKLHDSDDVIAKRNINLGPDNEPRAIVIASDAGGGPTSRALKTFLADRQPQQPGTVQVLLVIRQA